MVNGGVRSSLITSAERRRRILEGKARLRKVREEGLGRGVDQSKREPDQSERRHRNGQELEHENGRHPNREDEQPHCHQYAATGPLERRFVGEHSRERRGNQVAQSAD